MAVAVQVAGMGGDTGSAVHPFFNLTKLKGSPSNSIIKNLDSFVSNSQVELGSPVTTAQLITDSQFALGPQDGNYSVNSQSLNISSPQSLKRLALEDRLTASELKQSSQRKKRAYKKHNKGAEKSGTVDSEGKEIQQPSESGDSLSSSGTSPDLDIDPNSSRRKRRRTASAEPGTSVRNTVTQKTWEEQLQAAANSTFVPESTKRDRSGDIGADVSTRLQHDSNTVILPEQPHKAKATESPDHEDPSLRNEKPKKKMLMLRNDGRLASPKSRKDTNVIRPNTKFRSKRKLDATSTKILILKYGSDSATKSFIGQNINSILGSPVASKNSLAPADTSKVTVQPNVSAKVTHPFFLGKVTHHIATDTNHDTKSASSESKAPSKDTENPSPRKKISTATPNAAKAWAAIAEQGYAVEARATSKAMRFPGAMDPMWPPKDIQHCRGLSETPNVHATSLEALPMDQRRLKTSEVRIYPGESILDLCCKTYYGHMEKDDSTKTSSRLRFFHKPFRRLMTGYELQDAVRTRLVARLPCTDTTTTAANMDLNNCQDQVTNGVSRSTSTHSALHNIFTSIATSLSGFDKFECEARDWTSKYSPRDAASVLQEGREVTLLRDWLMSLTVVPVTNRAIDNPKSGEIFSTSKRLLFKRRKRRKVLEDLDDFIVSSDGELDEMDELAQVDTNLSVDGELKRSMIRIGDKSESSRQTSVAPAISNAVVISGPHGCGKTAAVYAVAQELGFEVFEINAGTRRSGKDVLDKVGDMTRNHLVQKAKQSDKMENVEGLQTAALQEDIDSGRQSTMQSFLKPDHKSKPVSKSRSKARVKVTTTPESPKKRKEHKQSLILLEEVDILFEEDKLFWTTILNLILQSRRPVIMTCTDESLLPLDDMLLHAIFRFTPPPKDLAADYLMLIAGNEGHLLSREAILILYESKQRDIRASITELNLWCQMAVGDAKGGLEWMLIRSHAEECHNQKGQPLRVVSDGTYMPYMGFLGSDRVDGRPHNMFSDDIECLAEALHGWGYHVEEWSDLHDIDAMFSEPSSMSRHQSFRLLENFDLNFDAQSAADLMQGFGPGHDNNVISSITSS